MITRTYIIDFEIFNANLKEINATLQQHPDPRLSVQMVNSRQGMTLTFTGFEESINSAIESLEAIL